MSTAYKVPVMGETPVSSLLAAFNANASLVSVSTLSSWMTAGTGLAVTDAGNGKANIAAASGYTLSHNDFTDTYKGYLDQDVRTVAYPTFAGLSVSGTLNQMWLANNINAFFTGSGNPIIYGSVKTGSVFPFLDPHSSGELVLQGRSSASIAGITLVTGSTPAPRVVVTNNGLVLVNKTSGTEQLEVAGKIRSDTAFNVNGTDGVTQAASAGKACDVTALAGGIATSQTQITYIADGVYSLVGITSITTANGRITAMA